MSRLSGVTCIIYIQGLLIKMYYNELFVIHYIQLQSTPLYWDKSLETEYFPYLETENFQISQYIRLILLLSLSLLLMFIGGGGAR